MMTGCPDVMRLKYFRSLGKWHNSLLRNPIALFWSIAAIIEITFFTNKMQKYEKKMKIYYFEK